MHSGIAIRIGRFPVQTLLGAWPGLGTQPCYKVPGDHRVENVKTVINIGRVKLSTLYWPKVGCGAAK